VSAPSLLDGRNFAHRHQMAFSTGYSHSARAGADPAVHPLDPIDRLALSLAVLCGEAVDPLAIVAGLEAEGHNDRLAQERHGLPDLFALAEELYRRVPRGVHLQGGHTGRPTRDRIGTIAKPLLRGSLFAVPALCGLALLPPAGHTGNQVRLGIAVIQILAWGYGQGLAHAAYARLNAGDLPAARDLLRRSTVWALLGEIGLFTLLALITGSAPSAVLPTATALGYCLAAVPALVLGAELKLAGVLAPVGLATIAWAFWLHDLWGNEGAGVIAGAAVLGALWLAWRLTRTVLILPGTQPGRTWFDRAKSFQAQSGRAQLEQIRRSRLRRCRAWVGRRWARALGSVRAWLGRVRRSQVWSVRAWLGCPRHMWVWCSRLRFGRIRLRRTKRAAHVGPGWVAGTIPQALYGSCVGIWLLLVLVGPIGATQAAQLHAAATLTLSMGAAEWHYVWYRQSMRRSLAANHELGGFARRAVVVLVLALTRQALTTALLATAVYTVLDQHSGGIGCYLFALALSPGLLAATVIRAVAARGLLGLTILALGATLLAQPAGGAIASAEIACVYAVAVAVAAARLSTRPWTNL